MTNVTGVVGLGPAWLQGRWQAVVKLKVGDAANRRRGRAGRAPGLQRPVHPSCAWSRLPVPGRDHAGHPAAPGEQPAGDPEAQVVGGGPVPQGGGPPSQRSAPAPAVPPQRPLAAPMPTQPSPGSPLTPRSGHGKHRRHFCRAHLWPHHRCLRGGHGVHMVHTEVGRVRRGEEVGGGRQEGSGTLGAEGLENCGTGSLTGGEEVARRRGGGEEGPGSQGGEGASESPGAEEGEKKKRREQTDGGDNPRA